MNAKSPANGRAPRDGLNVDGESTATGGHGADAWGKTPRCVARMTLSKDAIRLFIMISTYADGGSRLAWPSQETLAKELGWITRSTGGTDRYRISKAVEELLAADLIRKSGRQRLLDHDRAWIWRFLVAPYPEDAAPSYASNDAAASPASSGEDAYGNGARMRTNRVEDAAPSYAQSDPRTRPEESEKAVAARNENDEDQGQRQEQDPRPNPWASLPGRAGHDAA